jgi:hypothetical protein
MVNFTPKDDLLERFANSVGVGAVKSLAGLAGMTLR